MIFHIVPPDSFLEINIPIFQKLLYHKNTKTATLFLGLRFEINLNEIVRCAMKSSLCSDEIFGVPPQMKLNPLLALPAKRDFIALAISSTAGGFIPQKADLTEKSTAFAVLFSGGDGEI